MKEKFKKLLTRKPKKKETPKEMFISLVNTFLIILFIRTFFFSAHVIPSGSMYPNVYIGDYIFVSRTAYGYGQYTLPLGLIPFEGRFFDKAPERGDIVVFRNPGDGSDFIKRLIGLPGDRIQMKKGVVYLNGKALDLHKLNEFEYVDDHGVRSIVEQYEQTIERRDGTLVKHKIIKHEAFGSGPFDDSHEYTVPEGHYFMMGDNRDRSGDSRSMYQVGFVPHKNIIGQATIIFFSKEMGSWFMPWTWVMGIRLERFFNWIK